MVPEMLARSICALERPTARNTATTQITTRIVFYVLSRSPPNRPTLFLAQPLSHSWSVVEQNGLILHNSVSQRQ